MAGLVVVAPPAAVENQAHQADPEQNGDPGPEPERQIAVPADLHPIEGPPAPVADDAGGHQKQTEDEDNQYGAAQCAVSKKARGSTRAPDCPNNDAMTKNQTIDLDLGETTTKDVLRGVLSLPAPPPGRRLLDIGCGSGAVTRLLLRLGLEAIGIEPNADLLTGALADATRPAPPGRWIAARAEQLPIATDGVDTVLFCNSLHHIAPARQLLALAEAARVLRPGGEIVVIEPVAEGDYFELLRPLDDETAVRAAALEALSAAGRQFLQPVSTARFATFVACRSPADLVDGFTRADPARAERAHAVAADITRQFHALGETLADGRRRFAQPMTVQRLQKPG